MGWKQRVRKQFRREVYKRDDHCCRICGVSEDEVDRLDAHHITDRNDMPYGGYVKENGISLCPDCHLKAEKFHMTDGWHWEEGFHPKSLYFRIDSSYEKAVAASKQKLAKYHE